MLETILKPNFDGVSGHMDFTECKIVIWFEANSLNYTKKRSFTSS